MKVNISHSTIVFDYSNILGVLHIVGGEGFMNYCYKFKSGEVLFEENALELRKIVEFAQEYCEKNNVILKMF